MNSSRAIKKAFVISMVLVVSACSGSKPKEDDLTGQSSSVAPEASLDGADAKTDPLPDAGADVAATPGDQPTPISSDAPATDAMPSGDSTASTTPDATASPSPAVISPDATAATDTTSSASSSATSDSGETQSYRIKKGDTLMRIAFMQYSDVTRWKEIYDLNHALLKDANKLDAGTTLQLKTTGMEKPERPSGKRYVIQHGDTLAKISNHLYGSNAKWKDLWNHNKTLIKDPNRIYAGFFLYYEPSDHVPDVASQTPATTGDKASSSTASASPAMPAPAAPAMSAPAPVSGGLAGLAGALNSATPN